MRHYLTPAARRRRAFRRKYEHRMPADLRACLDDIRLAWSKADWRQHPNPILQRSN